MGEYGQGKSVLALKIAHRLLHGAERVPILITLGDRSPRTQTKLEILADWAAAYDINPKALLLLHEVGRLLLIFDGFDEMDLVGDATLRLDHFRTLWEFSRDRHSKSLITGRPNFFLDQLERETSLNVRPASMEVSYTVPIYLRPFNVAQIARALRAFDEGVRTQIVSLVETGTAAASFRDLVSRPSTLFLAANIWRELRAIENIRSAEVIGRFIAHSYERQQRKSLKSFLSSLEREYFTVGIAIATYNEARYSNHISKESFQRAIIKLIDGFPDELRKYDLVTDKQRSPLKERLQDREMLVETVSTEVRSCGIIVTDLSQIDTFKFAHKSFFEFLMALNAIYVDFGWPISKDKILHHAARGNIGIVRSSQILNQFLLFPFDRLLTLGMNREMSQFSGESLYRLLGANAQMTVHELEAKLNELNIPIWRLRRICTLWRQRSRRSKSPGIAVGASIFSMMISGRITPGIFIVMASLFRTHGQGGGEFIMLDDEMVEARRRALDWRIEHVAAELTTKDTTSAG